MSMTEIHMLWGQRRSQGTPELMVAWDEFTIDANPNGFDDEKKASIAAWDDELLASRTMIVRVPDDAIDGLFDDVKIDAVVVPTRGSKSSDA